MRTRLCIAPLLAALMFASSVLAAADDELIVFSGYRWSPTLETGTAAIYVIRPDGRGLRRLTRPGGQEDTAPAFSPDGRRIAFGRRDTAGWRLMVMRRDGSGVRAIVSRRPLAETPSWAPDGRRIAFAALPAKLPMTGSVPQQIWIVGAGGSGLRKITSAKFGAGEPDWSPDGTRIAYSSPRTGLDNPAFDIWSVRPDGARPRRLIRDGAEPAWSPDGRWLAFARRGDVYVATSGGTVLRRLTNTRAQDSQPSWSADGTRIAFASITRASDQRDDDMRLSIISADGSGHPTRITDTDPLFWADAPDWLAR